MKLKHAQKGSAFGAMMGLLVYLNVAVLGLSGLTAHRLILRPGLEDLAQRAGDRQAGYTDPIWKENFQSESLQRK